MPKVRPAIAVLTAVVIHGALAVTMLTMPEIPSAEWLLGACAIVALVLPGLVAGALTSARPLIVGLCATVAVLTIQGILTYILSSNLGGVYSWAVFLQHLPGFSLQALFMLLGAVAAFRVRAHLDRARSAMV